MPLDVVRRRCSIALAIGSVFAAHPVWSDTVYWDTNGANPGSGNATTGVWDQGGLANWSLNSAGTDATQAFASGDVAVFSAGVDNVAATTVTVSGTVNAGGITFNSQLTGFTITGGSLQFSGPAVIDSSALGAASSTTIILATPITTSSQLTFNSHGNVSATGGSNGSQLRLSGNNSGLTGGIAITSGLVDFLNTAAAGTGTITLSNFGGILDANHNLQLTNAIHVESTGGTIRSYGTNATTNFSGPVTGTGNINRTDGGTMTMSGSGAGYSGTFNNQGGTTVFTHTNWNNAGFNVTAGTLNFTPTTAAATTAIKTLSILGTVNVNNTGTLNVVDGALALRTSSAATVAGSKITSSSGTLAVTSVDATGTLTTGNLATGNHTISAVITDFTAGTPLTVTKAGSNQLTLGGANTYTGGTSILSGRVGASNVASFGTGTVTVSPGAQAYLTVAGTIANGFVVSGNGVAEAAGPLGAIRFTANTVSGPITLAADSRLNAHGSSGTISGGIGQSGGTRNVEFGGSSSAGTINLITTASTYTGLTTVSNTTLNVGTTAAPATTNLLAATSGFELGAAAGSGNGTLGYTIGADIAMTQNVAFNTTASSFNVTSANGSTLTATGSIGGPNAGAIRVNGAKLALGSTAVVSATSLALASTPANSATAAIGTLGIAAGASVTANYLNIGDGNNTAGIVNQTGGTVTLIAGGNGFRLGHWTNGANTPGSQYNLTGGTLDATALSGNTGAGPQRVNVGWDGMGLMTVGGGATTATLKAFGIQIDGNGDTAAFNSTLTIATSGVVEVASVIAGASTLDRVILAGGTVRPTAASTWSNRFEVTAPSTFDLNGQTVALTGSIDGAALLTLTGTAPSTLNVSGVLTAAQVAINAGTTLEFSHTSATSVPTAFSGSGAIRKTGTGALTLTGSSNFNGSTTVTTGTLNLAGSLASSVSIADAATIAGEGTVGSLTLGTTAGTTLLVDPTTAGALSATGNVTLNGVTAIQLPTTSITAPFTVLNFGTLTGTVANLTIAGTGYRSPQLSQVGNSIVASLGNLNLTWTGSVNGTWDLGSTANTNWTNGSAQNFFNGDNVTFDGSSGVGGVTLTGTLAPGSVTVSSSTTAYTLTASTGNTFSGTMSLLKRGTATLVMAGNVANPYTGGTIISAGAIDIQNAGSLGTGTITLGDAATGTDNVALYLATNRSTVATPVVISAQGTGTATLGSRSSVTGSGANNQFNSITLNRDVVFDSNAADRTDYRAITGTGNILVRGSGRSIFSSANTFVGNLTVGTGAATSGTLQLGTNSAAFDAIPNASNVTIAVGGLLNLSFAANVSETINALSGGGTLGINGSNANTIVIGSAGGSGTFAGLIRNSSTGTPVLSVTKAGAGTQTFSGANTYTGTTSITGGTLLASNDPGVAGSATGTGAVSVATGARLGGTGRVGGATTFATGSILAPGGQDVTGSLAGQLSFGGDVTLAAGTTYEWQISDPGVGAETDPGAGTVTAGGTFDRATIVGTLTIATGETVNLSIKPIGSPIYTEDYFYRWQIASAGTANVTASQFVLVDVPADDAGAYAVEVANNNVFLTFDESARVPEPAATGLLALAGAGLLARRRRALR